MADAKTVSPGNKNMKNKTVHSKDNNTNMPDYQLIYESILKLRDYAANLPSESNAAMNDRIVEFGKVFLKNVSRLYFQYPNAVNSTEARSIANFFKKRITAENAIDMLKPEFINFSASVLHSIEYKTGAYIDLPMQAKTPRIISNEESKNIDELLDILRFLPESIKKPDGNNDKLLASYVHLRTVLKNSIDETNGYLSENFKKISDLFEDTRTVLFKISEAKNSKMSKNEIAMFYDSVNNLLYRINNFEHFGLIRRIGLSNKARIHIKNEVKKDIETLFRYK